MAAQALMMIYQKPRLRHLKLLMRWAISGNFGSPFLSLLAYAYPLFNLSLSFVDKIVECLTENLDEVRKCVEKIEGTHKEKPKEKPEEVDTKKKEVEETERKEEEARYTELMFDPKKWLHIRSDALDSKNGPGNLGV